MSIVAMTSTGQPKKSHIITGIFSFDIGLLYLAGKTPLLVRDMLVNFRDILPETSKSSACWNTGRNCNLKWMSVLSIAPWWNQTVPV